MCKHGLTHWLLEKMAPGNEWILQNIVVLVNLKTERKICISLNSVNLFKISNLSAFQCLISKQKLPKVFFIPKFFDFL